MECFDLTEIGCAFGGESSCATQLEGRSVDLHKFIEELSQFHFSNYMGGRGENDNSKFFVFDQLFSYKKKNFIELKNRFVIK